MSHQAQPPDSGPGGGWLPPAPPGTAPPPPAPAPQPAPPPPAAPPSAPAPQAGGPWQPTLYYTYREPGNDAGVAGFALSVGAVALLFFTFGLASPLAFPLAIVGTLLSLRGRRRVKRGETTQHGGLAAAGFWIGLVSIIAAIGATVGWVLAIVNGHVFDTKSTEPNRQAPAVTSPRR